MMNNKDILCKCIKLQYFLKTESYKRTTAMMTMGCYLIPFEMGAEINNNV